MRGEGWGPVLKVRRNAADQANQRAEVELAGAAFVQGAEKLVERRVLALERVVQAHHCVLFAHLPARAPP